MIKGQEKNVAETPRKLLKIAEGKKKGENTTWKKRDKESALLRIAGEKERRKGKGGKSLQGGRDREEEGRKWRKNPTGDGRVKKN